VREGELGPRRGDAGGPQRVGQHGRPLRLQAGERGGMAQRRRSAQHGQRPRQVGGAVGEPAQLLLHPTGDDVWPDALDGGRRGLVGRDAFGLEVGEQGRQQEGVAAGRHMAGAGELGVGAGQRGVDDRRGGGGVERAQP
jgi:hypothetical protein